MSTVVDGATTSSTPRTRCVRSRVAIPRLTDSFPDLTLEEGYAIQAEGVARRVAAGERVIGAKLGLTSRAKQVQMSVAEPLFGVLLSGGVHPAGDPSWWPSRSSPG